MNSIRSRRAATAALLLGMMVFASGCAVTQETRQSLAGYVQAMDQVEQSADVFLADFSNDLKVQDDLKRVAGISTSAKQPLYPHDFILPPPLNAALNEIDSALAAVRQALLVVHEYNAALVALAEGQSEQEVRQRATAFGTALQPLADLAKVSIPGLSQLAGIGSTVLKLAQDASNRQQLQQAIERGRPAVVSILEELEKQTPLLYDSSVKATSQGESKLKDEVRRTAITLGEMIRRLGPPTRGDMLASSIDVQVQLTDIGQRTGTLPTMPIPLPFTGGLPPYDAAADAEVKVFVKSLRSSADRFAELIAKQNAYYQLMAKYVAAMRQTRRSLELVADSLNRPMNLRGEAVRLLNVAFGLRDAMALYRNPPPASALP